MGSAGECHSADSRTVGRPIPKTEGPGDQPGALRRRRYERGYWSPRPRTSGMTTVRTLTLSMPLSRRSGGIFSPSPAPAPTPHTQWEEQVQYGDRLSMQLR